MRRDGGRCRVCSSPDALHVHHILYDGLAWQAPDNALISLCEKCHERAHNISKRHFLPIVGVCETHSATEANTLLSEGWGIMHFLPDDGFGSPKFIMGKKPCHAGGGKAEGQHKEKKCAHEEFIRVCLTKGVPVTCSEVLQTAQDKLGLKKPAVYSRLAGLASANIVKISGGLITLL